MYAIAEEENELVSYHQFLENFPRASRTLRTNALKNSILLEAEFNYKKIQDEGDNDEKREKIARQLYVEAIRAKESGDKITFIRKYNTVLYSPLFSDTQTAFDLFRDKELAKLIKSLRNEIIGLRHDVRNSTRAITKKLDQIIGQQADIISGQRQMNNSISRSSSEASEYQGRLLDLQREQANDLSKYYNSGKYPSNWLGSPKTY